MANEWNVALHSSSSTGGERVRIWETVALIYSFRPSLLYTPASLDVKPIKIKIKIKIAQNLGVSE